MLRTIEVVVGRGESFGWWFGGMSISLVDPRYILETNHTIKKDIRGVKMEQNGISL